MRKVLPALADWAIRIGAVVGTVVLANAFAPAAHAQEAVTAAQNFTTMMRNVAGGAAGGLFVGGLLFKGIGAWASMPRLGMGGVAAMGIAVLLGVANRVLTFATDSANYILG